MAGAPPELTAWAGLGTFMELSGHRIFAVDAPASGAEEAAPLLVLHGFPTSSFDFHAVLPALRRRRRVLLPDLLGYGLSAKPDQAYTLTLQADLVQAYVAELGLSSVALLTHDVGDTVGGELLARQLEGRWPVEVTSRVITNGSIYMDLVHLSAGQHMLLAMPDARLPAESAIGDAAIMASLRGTFGPDSAVAGDELAAMAAGVTHQGGGRLLPRLIRYVEERLAHESRYTGAIERHPSALSIVWGTADPIAVASMADRLAAVRPDAAVTRLDAIGHYPMVEAPAAFADAVTAHLGRPGR